jgi:TonB family protein
MSRKLRINCTCIALLLVCAGSAVAQTPNNPGSGRMIKLRPARDREIPNATQPSTPDEAKWWQDIQEAAKAVQNKRGGKKETQRFLDLLQVGQEKSYQPPVPDTRPFILSKAEPGYTERARAARINGGTTLTVVLRPDGFVGEVEVVKGLGYGLDERSAEAARRTIFLPAVKDRKFVSYTVHMEMFFSVY